MAASAADPHLHKHEPLSMCCNLMQRILFKFFCYDSYWRPHIAVQRRLRYKHVGIRATPWLLCPCKYVVYIEPLAAIVPFW